MYHYQYANADMSTSHSFEIETEGPHMDSLL